MIFLLWFHAVIKILHFLNRSTLGYCNVTEKYYKHSINKTSEEILLKMTFLCCYAKSKRGKYG